MNCATFRARAGRKCHTLLTSNALRLRIGMRWQTEIPLHEIRAVRPYEPSDARLPGFRRVPGIAADQADFGDVLRARASDCR